MQVRGEIGVRCLNAGIDSSDHHAGIARRKVPGFERINVVSSDATIDTGVM